MHKSHDFSKHHVVRKLSYLSCFLLWFVFYPCFSSAQNDYLDSLGMAMQQADLEADRLHASVMLAQEMMPGHMDSARDLLEDAYPLEESQTLRYQAQYFNAWGLYYWHRRERNTSIAWYQKTLAFPADESILDLKAAAANNAGAQFFRLGKPDSASAYLKRSLDIDTRRMDEPGMAKTKFDLSRLYESQNQYELAFIHITEAINLMEEQDDPAFLPYFYNVLGNVLRSLHETEQAAEAYKQAHHNAVNLGITGQKIIFYNNMAALLNYVSTRELSTAHFPDTILHYTRKGLELAREVEDIVLEATLLSNEAQAWNAAGQPEQALELYQAVMGLLARREDTRLEMDVAHFKGKTYRTLGLIEEARAKQKRSLELARMRQSVGNQSDALLELAALDSLQGDHGGFARHYMKGIELRDSIWNQENRSRIAEIQIIHETEQQVQEITQLKQQEQVRQLRMTIIVAGSGLVVVLFLLIILYLRKRQKMIQQQYQIRQKQIESKLEANRRELTGKALSLARTDQLIRQLKQDIRGLMNTSEEETKALQAALRLLNSQGQSKQLWKEFENRFNELNEGFISELKLRFPTLTPAEIRLCTLLRLQLSNKEIANTINRSIRTIEHTRERIRQKMGLQRPDNLVQHLLQI